MIRQNRYNDPALGQAFNNIASLFAPPGAADLANYAQANATRQKSDMLAQLFANPNDPLADRRATFLGSYNPTQSWQALQMSEDRLRAEDLLESGDRRYGFDTTARTTLATNAADNDRARFTAEEETRRAIAEASLAPLNQGQARAGTSQGLADMYGMPVIEPFQGLPAPLSLTEQQAAERQRLIDTGQLTDQLLLELTFGDQTPTPTVDASGNNVYSTPGAAMLSGARVPPPATGSQAAPELGNYRAPDGTAGTAVFREGQWVDTQTNAPLPAGVQIFKAATTGGVEDALGRPTSNYIERQILDGNVAKQTAVRLRDLILASPASNGAVGWLRGTAQNVVQAGGEIGQLFGGAAQEVARAIENGAADAEIGAMFDPSIPAIEMLGNLLAFQYAKMTTGERLSNEMVRLSRQALGLDRLTANQQDSVARLNEAIAQIEMMQNMLADTGLRGQAVPSAAVPPVGPRAALPGAPPPTSGGRVRYDANGNRVP